MVVLLQLLDSSAGRSPLQITAEPTDSITHIRSQISSLHPAAPAVGDIRLVRGGRLLRDGETVLDVLGGDAVRAEEHGPHLIHLVLRPGKQQAPAAPSHAANSPAASSSSSSTLLGLDGRPVHLPAAAGAASSASPPAQELASAAASTQLPAGSSTSTVPPSSMTQLLSYYHAVADALSLYSYLAEDALREMRAAPRLSWEGQQPAPLVSLSYAKALVRQTMDAVGIESALGDAMDACRRLDEWVQPGGQELEVEVDDQPFALAIPPLATLSAEEQYTIQRYLMFTTRLTLLEALLRANPPGPLPSPPATVAALPTPTPTVPTAANRNQVAVVMTLLAMNLIKYVVVWYIFTQDDGWLDSCLWAAGLTAVWLWEAWKGYRRLQPAPPVVPSTAATNSNGLETDSTDPDRPLRPLPRYRLPSAPTPFHALLAVGLQTETDRLRLSPPPTSARRRAAGLPRPSILKPLLLPPFLLVCSIVPPLEAYRRRLIRQRETAMRALSEALTARAPAEPDSVDADAGQPRRLVPDGLPGAPERDYWRRVLEREERVDWAEEEEAQRRLGGEREDREQEEVDGGLLALLF